MIRGQKVEATVLEATTAEQYSNPSTRACYLVSVTALRYRDDRYGQQRVGAQITEIKEQVRSGDSRGCQHKALSHLLGGGNIKKERSTSEANPIVLKSINNLPPDY